MRRRPTTAEPTFVGEGASYRALVRSWLVFPAALLFATTANAVDVVGRLFCGSGVGGAIIESVTFTFPADPPVTFSTGNCDTPEFGSLTCPGWQCAKIGSPTSGDPIEFPPLPAVPSSVTFTYCCECKRGTTRHIATGAFGVFIPMPECDPPEIRFQLACDANGDGNIDVLDLVAVANQILGIALAPGEPDCNGDTNVDVLDLVSIANEILGL